MLTEFGKEIRKLRIDKGLRLLDLAKQISMSSAFVSAVETGRKPMPNDYLATVAGAMGLSVEEVECLERAADKDRSQISIENLPSDKRELIAAFARRPNNVPQHLLDALRKAVFKSLSGSSVAKSTEIEQNLARFLEMLPELVPEHAGKWALIRHCSVIRFYETAIDAQIAGNISFDDKIFSIQLVKEEAEELGYFSYAVDTRIP